VRTNAGKQARNIDCERGLASENECERVLASSRECEPTGGRATASQHVGKLGRASVKEFWQARASASECERVLSSGECEIVQTKGSAGK